LRNECARVKAAACVDEDERYERIRAGRSLRHWTDADGMGRIDVRGPVDATARVLARLAPYEQQLFDAARADDRRERSDALAFDALLALADAPAGAARITQSETTSSSASTMPRCCVDTPKPERCARLQGAGRSRSPLRPALSKLGRLCRHHHAYKHRHRLRLAGSGTRKQFLEGPPAAGQSP
jgi:hypothetical protein